MSDNQTTPTPSQGFAKIIKHYTSVAFNTTVRIGKAASKRIVKEGIDFIRYKKWIMFGPNKYISPKERQKLREIYFDKREFKEPIPSDSDGRLSLTYKFTKQIPPDFEAAIMLFDPELDLKDNNWLCRMGWLYGEKENNPYFDPIRGIFFELEAAKAGHATAQYNLGISAQNGYERERSIDEAEHWYSMAAEQDYTYAVERLANLRIQYPQHYLDRYASDPRAFFSLHVKYNIPFDLSAEDKLQAITNALLKDAYSKGCYELGFTISSRHRKGQYPDLLEPDHPQLYSEKTIFELMSEQERYDSSPETARLYLALISFLGYDADRDIPKAFEWINKISDSSNTIYVRTSLAEQKKKFGQIFLDSLKNKQEYDSVISLVVGSVKTIENAEEFLSNIRSGSVPCSRILANVLHVHHRLSSYLEHETTQILNDMVEEVECRLVGVTVAQMKRSAFIKGPMYNRVSRETGLPILGQLSPPCYSKEVAREQFNRVGMFVPAPGIVHINGIKGFSDGTFELDVIDTTGTPNAKPAMILDEDIEVALVLMFGARLHINDVVLSMESPDSESTEGNYGRKIPVVNKVLTYKMWNPKWLGRTHFGRTMLTVDDLIGVTCWYPREFELLSHTTPEMKFLINDLVEDIMLTGGRQGAGSSKRAMLRPGEQVYITTTKQKGVTLIDILDFPMKVDGSYIMGKDRAIVQNDTNYEQGRVCRKLSDRYMDIATLMPIFERARQLTAMLYAFSELRNSGWQPSKELQAGIDAAHRHCRSLPELPLSELLMKSAPFKFRKQ